MPVFLNRGGGHSLSPNCSKFPRHGVQFIVSGRDVLTSVLVQLEPSSCVVRITYVVKWGVQERVIIMIVHPLVGRCVVLSDPRSSFQFSSVGPEERVMDRAPFTHSVFDRRNHY
jgi:hypothetical protein